MNYFLEKHNAKDIAEWMHQDPNTGCITIDERCPWVVRTKPNAKPQIRCWTLNPEKQDKHNNNLHSLQMFAWVVLGKNPYPGRRQFKTTCGNPLCMNPDHLILPEKQVRKNKIDKKLSKILDEYAEEAYGDNGFVTLGKDKPLFSNGHPFDLMRNDEDKELQKYLHWLAKSPAIRTLMQEMKQSLAGKKDNLIAKMLFADILLSNAKQYDKAKEYYDIVHAIRDIQSVKDTQNVVSLLRQRLKG